MTMLKVFAILLTFVQVGVATSTMSTTDLYSTTTDLTSSTTTTEQPTTTTTDMASTTTDLYSTTTDPSTSTTTTDLYSPTTDPTSTTTTEQPSTTTTDIPSTTTDLYSTTTTDSTTTTTDASSGTNNPSSTSDSTGTSTVATTTTPTPSSLLNSVNLTETSFTYEGSNPVSQFRCEFTDMTSPYRYEVVWKVGGVNVKTTTYEATANVSTIVLKDYEIGSFMLDSQIMCSVRVLDSDGINEVVSAINSTVITPVEISTTSISLQRGSTAQISILNNLYFGCYNDESCSLEFLIYDINSDYSCSNSTIAVLGETTCGKAGTVKTTSDVSGGTIIASQENLTFAITTKNDFHYSLQNSFTLRVKVMVTGSSSSRTQWTGEFSQTIAVIVTEPSNLTFVDCTISTTGRINTFDTRDYNIGESEGEFVLYRHTSYDAEIQVQTKPCIFNSSYTCVHGVSVRAGQDVYTISHYGLDHLTAYASSDSSSSNLLVRKISSTYYSSISCTPGGQYRSGVIEYADVTDEKVEWFSSKQRKCVACSKVSMNKVLLPYGTEVRVKRHPLIHDVMHVAVTPSPSDVQNIKGLCGNLNDDSSDDLTKRDGTTASGNTDMASSWSVASTSSYPTENMFDTTNHANLTTWSANHKLCVCPGGHTTAEKICGAQEDQTCSNGDITRTGTVVSATTSSRRKRDIESEMDELEPYDHVMYRREDIPDLRNSVLVPSDFEYYNHHIVKRATDYSNAVIACEAGLTTNCPLFSFDWVNSTDERARIIDWCARDMVLNDTIDWVLYSCTDIQVLVLSLIERNNIYSDSDPTAVANIRNENCVGNCSNLGTCTSGACTCDSGIGGPECTLITSIPPTVISTGSNESIEMTVGFTCIDMTTDGASDEAVCKIDTYLAVYSDNSQTLQMAFSSSITVSATVVSYNSLQCCLPAKRRRRRSTTTTNTQYRIMTSNNGINFSTPITLSMVDSTCQNVTTLSDGTKLIILLGGYCFIGGQCVTEGSANSASSCQYCTTSYNLFAWNDTCAYDTSDDDGLEGWAIGLITLSAIGAIAVIATLAYILLLKQKINAISLARVHAAPQVETTNVKQADASDRYMLREDSDVSRPWA